MEEYEQQTNEENYPKESTSQNSSPVKTKSSNEHIVPETFKKEEIVYSKEDKIKACIQLIKKLPISLLDENITAISNIIYEDDDLLNEFLQKVDSRTEISREDATGFIKCEYNRDGDSYRSPHTNRYFPASEDELRFPRNDLRELEIKLNKMFSIYSRAYYSSTATTSVYCWELGDKIEHGFAVAVVVKNIVDLEKHCDSGIWDSSNVINVTFTGTNNKLEAHYKITSSIVLQMKFHHKICGQINLSGTVSKQVNYQ